MEFRDTSGLRVMSQNRLLVSSLVLPRFQNPLALGLHVWMAMHNMLPPFFRQTDWDTVMCMDNQHCSGSVPLLAGLPLYSCPAAPCLRTDQCCSVTAASVRLSIVVTCGANSTALFTA